MADKPIKLRCLGTGDAFGSGGRLQSCYHLKYCGGQLLLDCGCSSLIGMRQWGINPVEIDTVIISHLHGDHFGGVPYLFLEGKYVSQRTRPLTIIGPPGLQQRVEKVAEAFYPGLVRNRLPFPVEYRQLNPQQSELVNSATIKCFRVEHGGSKHAYGVRVEIQDKVVSYTGDTEWTDNLIPLSQGSDLLIAECFAYDQPIPSHLDYQTLLKQRNKLASKWIVLTHMGPEMLTQRQPLEFEMLSDGDLLEL
ncbi:MAG: MBL fold metallo-hydrolase [Desulfuromonadales bacterium]|nr:MBL fold metallo-hydrolase [Desulfuromonadales bacterium]